MKYIWVLTNAAAPFTSNIFFISRLIFLINLCKYYNIIRILLLFIFLITQIRVESKILIGSS